MLKCQYSSKWPSCAEMERRGEKRSLGMISCLETIWQNLLPHFSRRITLERASLPSSGDPKVMQRSEQVEERVGKEVSNQSVVRDAIAPPIEWPVKTTALLLFTVDKICNHANITNSSVIEFSLSNRRNVPN